MRKWRKSLCGLLVGLGAAMTGCWQEHSAPKSQGPSFRGITLKVGALDEKGLLDGVVSQRGEWIASRGGEIAIVEKPVAVESAGEVDVLVFPGDRLGDLIEAGRLEAIPNGYVMPATGAGEGLVEAVRPPDGETKDSEDPFDYGDIATPYRDHVTRYGNQRMALPYGASALVLVYRRDAFESEANRAAAAKQGLKLEPPRTWEQLDALARFFQGRDWNGDGSPDSGIAMVLGDDPEGLGNATFLARAAAWDSIPTSTPSCSTRGRWSRASTPSRSSRPWPG